LGVGQLGLERRSGHANYFSTTPQRSSISFQLGRKYLIAACIVNYGALSTENTASKCSPVKKEKAKGSQRMGMVTVSSPEI